MVEKTGKKDSNIVDFPPGLERSLATPLRASRFDHSEESDVADMPREREQGQRGKSVIAAKQFDFAFHALTETDILNLKIVGFSLLMAAAMMMLGFTIAAGILKLF